jgi:hypothetical protein
MQSHCTLNFCLKNSAATRDVSPNSIKERVQPQKYNGTMSKMHVKKKKEPTNILAMNG